VLTPDHRGQRILRAPTKSTAAPLQPMATLFCKNKIIAERPRDSQRSKQPQQPDRITVNPPPQLPPLPSSPCTTPPISQVIQQPPTAVPAAWPVSGVFLGAGVGLLLIGNGGRGQSPFARGLLRTARSESKRYQNLEISSVQSPWPCPQPARRPSTPSGGPPSQCHPSIPPEAVGSPASIKPATRASTPAKPSATLSAHQNLRSRTNHNSEAQEQGGRSDGDGHAKARV